MPFQFQAIKVHKQIVSDQWKYLHDYLKLHLQISAAVPPAQSLS